MLRYLLPATITLFQLACRPAQKPQEHRIDFRDIKGVLPDLGRPEVRLFFDGGACCPDHSIPRGFREEFRSTVLFCLQPMFPDVTLIETVEPALDEWQMEIDFVLAEEDIGPSGRWPCLIEIIVARTEGDAEAHPRRTEVAFWSRKLAYGKQDHILEVLKGQLGRLTDAAAGRPTQPAHAAGRGHQE